MAHNINKKDDRDSMFYVTKEGTPWHGLGVGVNQALTANEALHYANLDYEVKQQPLWIKVGGKDIKVDDKLANVRMDTNQILGVVGNRYSILQNKEAFSFFDPLVASDEAIYHTAGVLGKGEVIWIMAKLPDYINGPDGNPIEQNVVIYNSHNGTKSLTAMFTPIRVVCENTLNFAIRSANNKVTIRHSGDVKVKLEEAHRILGLSMDYFKKIQPIFNNMHDVKASDTDVKAFAETLFPVNDNGKNNTRTINLQNELINSINNSTGQDIDHTLYWLYNGGVAYFDNDKKYKDETARLAQAWFNTNMKQKAYAAVSNIFADKTGHELVSK